MKLYYIIFTSCNNLVLILAWKSNGLLWVAGKKSGGVWKWFGRATGQIILADWEQIQPDGSGDCMQIFNGNRASTNNVFENYKWDDTSCNAKKSFVCEKIL